MKTKFYILFNWLVVLSLLSVSWTNTAQATPLTLAATPQPLPNDCIGVTPPGEPNPCCAYGYIFYGGTALNDVEVKIQSAAGSITTRTQSGPASSLPYYRVSLSSAPLNAKPGERLTFTATSGRLTVTESHVIHSNGNQIDLSFNGPNVELIGHTGGVPWSVIVQGNYAYLGLGARLVILNITNPNNPVMVGQTAVLPGTVEDIAISGSYAYVANGAGGLQVIKIIDPANPVAIGWYNTPARDALGVAVSGNYAYLADGSSGLRVVNIANPAFPVEVGFYDTPGNAVEVTVSGNYAYVAGQINGLRIVNIANPSSPVEVGFYDTPGNAYGVVVSGSYAYVTDGESGLRILNISNPTAPVEAGFYDVPGSAIEAVISENYIYVAAHMNSVRILNIINPTKPIEVGFYNTPAWIHSLTVSGNYVYAGDDVDGLRIVNIANPTVPVKAGNYGIQGGDCNNITIQGNYAYLASDNAGMRIVSIADPTAPVEVGFYDTPGNANGIAVSGNYAYVTDSSSGLRVINIANPVAPVEVGFYDTPGNANGVVISGNYAYVTDDLSGLRVINIANPVAPIEVGFYDTPGNANDVAVSGNYAYVVDGGSGLRVINIANPAAPVEVGFYDTPGTAHDVAISGNYAYLADQESGLRVINIANPVAPVEVGFYDTSGAARRVAISENYAYVADTWDGLRIIDIINPAAPVEVGYYDPLKWGDSIAISGNHAYVASWCSGLFVLHLKNLGSPPSASISYIWYAAYPGAAVQGTDTVYFNGSATDNDEGGAYIVNYEWSSNRDGLLSAQEDFVLPAAQLSPGTHTISFRAQDNEGEWSPAATRTLTVQAEQGDVQTLILVNRQKLAGLYSAGEADALLSKLHTLATNPAVNGLVVQLENDAAVAAAVAARGADYENKSKANTLAETIRQVIFAQWNAHPTLKYVVLVGDDRALPFYRIVDGTHVPDPWTLTDDFYVDKTPTPCSGCANSTTYIPDLAAGRLVETPAQMSGQVDTFLASSTLNFNSAITAGYDFVQDGAQAHCNTLRAKGLSPDCSLIGENWTAAQFTSKVLNTYHAACSINAHANEYGFGTPSGFVSASDFANAPTDFSRAIFYTVGCHAGLNVSNGLDLPESLARMRAIYIANTGYGWGGGGVVLSEELTWNFTKKLVFGSQTTPGEAFMLAKQQYYADHPEPGAYDEKITSEFVLYGLPMYQVKTSASLLFAQDAQMKSESFQVRSTEQVLANGLTLESKFISWPMPIAENTSAGTFYTLNGMVATSDSKPLLPRLSYEVGKPGLKLIGLVFTGGAFETVNAAPPIQQVVTTNREPELTRQDFKAPGWYPSIFSTAHRLELANGAKETIWATAGQYNPTLATGQQRIFTGMSFDLYYHANPSDVIAPKLTAMRSQLGSSAAIQVSATDASGIQAVVIAYTDGSAAWHSVSLTASGGQWAGNFPANAKTEFFVQVVDKAGNVTLIDQNGQYFHPGDSFLNKLYLPATVR